MMFFSRNKQKNRIFICSLPKAGTHLIMSCLENYPKLSYGGLCVDRSLSKDKRNLAEADDDYLIVGVDAPCRIKADIVSAKLGAIRNNRFVSAHMPYSRQMEEILQLHEYKGIAIIRDPRDVVVSHVHYILKSKNHYLHRLYKELGDFDINLMTSIMGIKSGGNQHYLSDIRERIEGMQGWSRSPLFIFVRFENVVGERGGGDSMAQYLSIKDIAEHIEINLSDIQIDEVAKKMFGGNFTFRKGVIGGWSESFKDEHKEKFKEVAGSLLVDLEYEEDFNW